MNSPVKHDPARDDSRAVNDNEFDGCFVQSPSKTGIGLLKTKTFDTDIYPSTQLINTIDTHSLIAMKAICTIKEATLFMLCSKFQTDLTFYYLN